MQEGCDIVTALVINKLAYWLVKQPCQFRAAYIARFEVEPGGIEIESPFKIGHDHAKVAHLVDRRRALLESLKRIACPILGCWLRIDVSTG
jgi:phage regulator Rha-like protein